MPPFKYGEAIREGRRYLAECGQETEIANLLMADLFSLTTTQLMVKAHDEMPAAAKALYGESVERVCAGEPYQYVVGFSWFYGEKFKVTNDTLIPRNETEELVLFVMERESDDGKTIVDIGTGTGVIPVTLQKGWTENIVLATDISPAALEVAKENAETHDVSVHFHEGDLYEPLIRHGIKADVIISNPPYISRAATGIMTPSVLRHEPHQALFADDSGLQIYKRLIDGLPGVLRPGGRVYCEIGFDQKEPLVEHLLEKWPGTKHYGVVKDMNQLDRILYFTWEG
ncbi:peptide chain release factor N(5)-glutamine methyltransferase [Lacicoccus alkaliphilus]|uniref:peptide chain release factor N(5)-glutamine methyltransferase n=1 Tax=Lacicoccus alkaliphilus DSM 16010 TaxID=1123231 RepID=A0A1M7IE32_9BACL|nr:peptide chain release factor N(5)-glutamine methyltransferase [Salinicoccus alkaliphilus]SHM38697.1 release factor glutamine methyltransferase [Salinicoccus alkaliphilus DSM 16010]